MMLDTPSNFSYFCLVSLIGNIVVGSVFSVSSVWRYLFSNSNVYLKAGEYGESRLVQPWSLWKEPINAWTSLSYSLFGGIALIFGMRDTYFPSVAATVTPANFLIGQPEFSMFFGSSCIFLGISSCLFHASHSEYWRSMDAGMTSGVTAPLLMMAFFDRARPIGIDAGWIMIMLGTIFQTSLTHGYLPYGSSDILLPSLIAICFLLELSPRYGGVVDVGQFTLWFRIIYFTLSGVLLRAYDILHVKHKSVEYGYVIKGYLALTLLFIYILGALDASLWVGAMAGLLVWRLPFLGHMFWHFFSSFALFYWWFMYYVRPGNPVSPRNNDISLLSLVFYMAIKNSVRRIFMTLPFKDKIKDRFMFLLEHLLFAYWGYQVIHVIPKADSWLANPALSWGTVVNSEAFHTFYLAKVATHMEDLLFIGTGFYLSSRTNANSSSAASNSKKATSSGHDLESAGLAGGNGAGTGMGTGLPSAGTANETSSGDGTHSPQSDILMNVHHVSTALLCIASYSSGYLRIGSVIMFLHDVSDLPLDMLRICIALNWDKGLIASFVLTLLGWAYWRLWYFPFYVIYSVAFESKSLWTLSSCFNEQCTWINNWPERLPFVALLLCLQFLHLIWFYQMIKKGQRELLRKK